MSTKKKAPSRAEETKFGLLDFSRPLDLDDVAFGNTELRYEIGHSLGRMRLERTMEIASAVTIDVLDSERLLLKDDRFADKTGRLIPGILLELDGLEFELAELEKTDPGEQLVFYDPAAARLQGFKAIHKFSRGQYTRAEAAHALCRKAGVPFRSLAEHANQPIQSLPPRDAKELRDAAKQQATAKKNGGIIPNPTGKRRAGQIKGGWTRLTTGQKQFGAMVAAGTGLSPKVIAVWMVFEENGTAAQSRERASNHNWLNIGPGRVYNTPTAGARATIHLLTSSKLYAGIMRAARGSISPYRTKATAEISEIHDSPWAPGQYSVNDFLSTLRNVPDNPFGNATGATDTSLDEVGGRTPDHAYVQRYEFRVERGENWWETLQRWASEVNWRCFAVNGVVYFENDLELARQPVAMVVRESDDDPKTGAQGVDSIRYLVTRAQRIDELTVTARLRPWAAPPGSVVVVVDEAPAANGRWLVRGIERDLLDPGGTATITLGKPVKPKAEPASTVKVTAGQEVSGPLRDRIVAEAKKTLSNKDADGKGGTGYNYYWQGTLLTADPTPPPRHPYRSDCSQWTRAIYLKAGAPDPGVNTWAQDAKGKRTKRPKPGDLVLYENHAHVELYVGNGKTIGHGSAPIDYGVPDLFGDGAYHFITFDFLDG